MQLLKMVAVYDAAMKAYQAPFFVQHEGLAIRGFVDAATKQPAQPTDLFNHPQDFSLYHLGDFDIETGDYYPMNGGKKLLISGESLVPSKV